MDVVLLKAENTFKTGLEEEEKGAHLLPKPLALVRHAPDRRFRRQLGTHWKQWHRRGGSYEKRSWESCK